MKTTSFIIFCLFIQSTGAQTKEAEVAIQRQLDSVLFAFYVKGSTKPYYQQFTEDGTYYGVNSDGKITGYDSIALHLDSYNGWTKANYRGPYNLAFDWLDSAAVLTYELDEWQDDGSGFKWNGTEVYAFIDGRWKVSHSHWSEKAKSGMILTEKRNFWFVGAGGLLIGCLVGFVIGKRKK